MAKKSQRPAVCTLVDTVQVLQSRLPSKIYYEIVNGKLLLQEFELLHTHPRRNAAVADFVCEFERFVKSR